jgi:hypothetical protein
MGELLALLKVTDGTELATGNKTMFEINAEPGLTTVTRAVPAEAMFAAGTDAVSFSLPTKVVASATPFHLTIAPETKPVPLTVRVNPDPPGAVLMGTRGWLMKGTGFADPPPLVMPVPVRLTVCVLPAIPLLLSVMVSVPVRVPVAVGEKVTLIVQEPLAAILLPQLLVWEISPLAVMPERLSAVLPGLLSMTA